MTSNELLNGAGICSNKVCKCNSFRNIANELSDLYEKKNHDYGDSFTKNMDKYGAISAAIRLSDKFNRFETLINPNAEMLVKDESIIDTLKDLASYAIMTVMWYEDNK